MATGKESVASPAQVNGDSRWALAQRVASSRHFAKAPQLHDFLLFITTRTLEGHEAEINEHSIGCSVLGRSKTFNPAEDNIVRVQARHLRKKVEDYFATDGREEPVIITIPKGGYVPHFELRPAPAEVTAEGPSAGAIAPVNSGRSAWKARIIWALTGAAVAAVLTTAAWWRRSVESDPKHPLLARVLQNDRETRIVVSDSSFVAVQDLLRTDLTLQEYMDPHFLENLLKKAGSEPWRSAMETLYNRQYTSLGDLNVSSRLLEKSHQYSGAVTVRFSRHVNLREFKTGNFIIVGSRRGIPWVRLFEDRLNFTPTWDSEAGRFFFGNATPRPGEQAQYGTESASMHQTYASIALVPNLDRTGDVLLLSGLTMEGTEAAGEFATQVQSGAAFRKLLGPDGGGYFEVLIRLSVVGGTARDPVIVAARTFGISPK